MYAIKDHVVGLHLSDELPIADVSQLPLSTFLPNVEDCRSQHREFSFLISSCAFEEPSCFKFLQGVVPDHIPHQYSCSMAVKSETVHMFL